MDQQFQGVVGKAHRGVIGAANRLLGRESVVRRMLSPVYSNLLYAVTAGRGVPGEINGDRFRLDPRYRWMMWPNYEEELAAFLRPRVKPGHCCVDIGANVGVYVLQMARWVGPHGRVMAFEPNPSTFDVLRRHVRMNGFRDRVTLVDMAAGRSKGTAELFDTNAGSGLARLGGPNPAIVQRAGTAEVRVVRLDDYLQAASVTPDLILIDVEGFEFEVLAGAVSTLMNPAVTVIVEMHPQLWPGGETSRPEAEGILHATGRRAISIDGRPDPWSVGDTMLEPISQGER